MSDSTLKELWQQVAEKKNCEAKQKELSPERYACGPPEKAGKIQAGRTG